MLASPETGLISNETERWALLMFTMIILENAR